MKALTMAQPFATMIALGLKTTETRSWSTSHRGLLAIHSSAAFPLTCRQLCMLERFKSVLLKCNPHFEQWDQRGVDSLAFPLGYILAYAELVDVRRTEDFRPTEPERSFGNYRPGRFAWLLANVRPLEKPVRTTGALGLWEWEPLVHAEVESEDSVLLVRELPEAAT